MRHMSNDRDKMLQTGQFSDPASIEALAQEYYEYVYHIAYSVMGDPHDADDVAQETFIAVHDNLERLEPGSNVRAWISKIALNHARMELRKRKTRETLTSALQTIQSLIGKAPSPEDSAIENEANGRLWGAVKNLKTKHRIPIILRYVYKYPIREIAQVLKIKEGTAHSRLYYAVQKLQEQLQLDALVQDENKENVS